MYLKQNLFFSLFKNENWRERQNKFLLLFFRSKTILAIFGKLSKILIFFKNFNFIFCNCSLKYEEGSCKISQKILIFKGPVIFWSVNLAAHATRARARPKSAIFWNWTHKNIPDPQLSVHFKIRKKVINHSTLPYRAPGSLWVMRDSNPRGTSLMRQHISKCCIAESEISGYLPLESRGWNKNSAPPPIPPQQGLPPNFANRSPVLTTTPTQPNPILKPYCSYFLKVLLFKKIFE